MFSVLLTSVGLCFYLSALATVARSDEQILIAPAGGGAVSVSIVVVLNVPGPSHADCPPVTSISKRPPVSASPNTPAFQCPAGTTSCAAVGRPNSCCSAGSTCVIITDTGGGDVGCCPPGAECGGEVSDCDIAAGYSSCPGGGCCIPGYVCLDIGCGPRSACNEALGETPCGPTCCPVGHFCSRDGDCATARVGTRFFSPPVRPTSATTSTLPFTTPVDTDSTMITPTLLPCPTGYKSCPGGGCCSTNRACGLSDCPPLSTETTSSPSVDTGCANPCGFGGSLCCSANEVCNVDDSNQAVCSKTSAPTSTPSFSVQPTWLTYATTYINSDLQTITSFYSSYITTAAPTITPPAPSWLPSQGQTSCGSICCSSGQYCVTPGQCAAIVDSPTGRSESGGCARGWYACPASMGAACCPTGYVCGREACTVAR